MTATVVSTKMKKNLKIKKGTKEHFEVTAKYFEGIAGILPVRGKATKALLKERKTEGTTGAKRK